MKSFFRSLLLMCIILNNNISLSASNSKELDTYIQNIIEQSFSVINNTKFAENEKKRQLENLMRRNLDLTWMASFVLGPHKRLLKPQEIENFTNLYSDYVVKAYAKKVRYYNGEKIVIKQHYATSKDQFVVKAEIMRKSGDPAVQVDFMVRDRDSFKIFDVITEGISMIMTQRSEFSSIISSKGYKHLLNHLKAHIQEE